MRSVPKFALCILALCSAAKTVAQGAFANAYAVPCYDAANKADIRLWDGRAPGAAGDDPCKDIPFLRVFPAAAGGPSPKPAIIIFSGSGYSSLKNVGEQMPVAEYFSEKLGITSFVLYYRLTQKDATYRYPVPMWDGQRAIKLVRSHAAALGVDPARVGIFGFAAGGHLASNLAVHSDTDFDLPVHDAVDSTSARPNLLGLGYAEIQLTDANQIFSTSTSVLLRHYEGPQRQHLMLYLSADQNISPTTPPVFLFESLDDAKIYSQNSIRFAKALKGAGIPVEARFFPHGIYGAGLASNVPGENAWPEMFHRWLVQQKFIPR